MWAAAIRRQQSGGLRTHPQVCVCALAEAMPAAAVVSFDASNAFNTIPRQNVLGAVARRAPALLGVANAWLARETTHTYWPHDGAALEVRAQAGVDQGCPLSPAFFAIGIADALSRADARLTHLHPSARIFSYLDDVVVVVPAGLADRACEIVEEELTAAGLTLNRDKTQAWTPARGTALPQQLEARRVDALTVLGNPVPWYDRDDGDGRLPVHGTTDGREVLEKTQRFLQHWRQLRGNGLSAEGAHTLLRTYAQGCATHLLRANYETAWAGQLDDLLWGAYEEFAGFAFDASQREQAKLGLSDGGCAFPSARDTAARAYLGSWALVLPSVAACLGTTSLEGFLSRCPRVARAMRSAEAELDAQGAKDGPINWGSYLAEPRAKLQGYWGKRASAHRRTQLLNILGEDDRIALRESSGTSAGSWLLPRQEGDALIPDAHFHVGLRKRLRADVCAPGARCQHRKRDGTICGVPLDAKGWHALKCGCGGSRDHRHNSLRDWNAPFHQAQTGHMAVTEKLVPAWDRVDTATGELEEARLDVATRDAATGQPIYVAWSVTCAHSDNVERRWARSNNDGLAASQAVGVKRNRYPPSGGELVPAVLESGGRPADELVSFVRSYGQDLPEAERSVVIATAWRRIQRTLVVGNAEMILSAC